MSQESLLSLLRRVTTNPAHRRELFEGLDSYAKAIRNSALPVIDYKTFLKSIHDVILRSESAVKSELLRIIRYGFVTSAHGDEIIAEEVHWLVIGSFEREGGELTERMQALKLMKAFISISPDAFPIGFARSLIAAAGQIDDGFRRVSLETLRELALANSYLVACCNGFKVLVEASVDPSLQDISDILLLTVLHLISQPNSRVNINVVLDLRILLSAFTDLDAAEGKDHRARLAMARSAVVTVMRTWVGVVLLTSDPLGLPVLIRLLKDSKVSPVVQETALETLTELFAPVVVKKKQLRIENSRMNEVIQQQAAWSLENNDLNAVRYSSTPGTTGAGGSAFAVAGMRSSVTVAAPPAVAESSWSSMFGSSRNSLSRGSMASRPPSNDLYGAPPDVAESDRRMSRGFGSFFNKSSSAKGPNSSNPNTPSNVVPLTRPTSRSFPGPAEDSSDSSGRNSDNEMVPPGAVNATLHGMTNKKLGDDNDLIFNIMDNYAAILCSAFMHVGVISSLCYLGSNAETKLAAKARVLLVNVLTVICGIFPEEKCTELLEIPALVEYAATVSNSNSVVTRSMKATEILADMAEAFSNYFAKHKMNRNYPDNEFSPLGLTSTATGSAETAGGETGGPAAVQQAQFSDARPSAIGSPKMVEPSAVSARPSIAWVAADLKNSCKPRVDGLLMSCRGVSASTDLMYDLRHAITAAIDKGEFAKQMERSLVIGKEGKEPMKWDWQTIDDMLEYSFKNPERLSDALKTKWVKRVSGFYRCTVDEKAYFANSEWEYGNIMFLECACNMYHVLVGCDAGMMFLSGGDRRGMLFNEMSYELEQLVSSTTNSGWNGMGNATKNVFRMSSCTQTLAREYFTLLGRMTNTASGRKLLDSTQVFQHLSMLGHSRTLDYCSRLALTALSFTDNGHFSRNLLQIFTTSGGCSSELRGYTHTLLRALLRKSRHTEFVSWGVEMMITQMMYFPSASLAKVLEEAAQDKLYLRSMVAKKANFVGIPNTERILLRYCSIPAGISLLKEHGWMDSALERWEKLGNDAYVSAVETGLARALFSSAPSKKTGTKEVTTPIPIEADVFYTSTPASALECGACVDLEGLLRIPWNIEVKLSTAAQQQPSATAALSAWEYLKVDSFLDASSLVSVACSDSSSDHVRVVKVRGLILDNTGVPSGYRVDSTRVVTSALLCGVNPVLRTGKVVRLSADSARYARARERRAKTVAQLKMEQLRASGSNFRGSMAASTADAMVDPELPITYQYEPQHDWSMCKPAHRGGRVLELADDRFAVEVPDEPVVFIFARSLVPPKKVGEVTPSRKPGAQRGGGTAYLVEVHYYLRLCTDQDTFVPIPRHMYGELARCKEGAALLVKGNIITNLLATVTSPDSSLGKRRAALWALGQIGSTEHGFSKLISEDPSFVKFAIDLAVSSPNYSLRGTSYFVLGLLGRSRAGMQCLAHEDWDVSPQVGVAVAVPRDVSVLFQTPEYILDPEDEFMEIGGLHNAGFVTAECARQLRPFSMQPAPSVVTPNSQPSPRVPSPAGIGEAPKLPPKAPVPVSGGMPPLPPQVATAAAGLGLTSSMSGLSLNLSMVRGGSPDYHSTSGGLDQAELLALNSIVKLTGQILYKESATYLKELRKQNSPIFQSRRMLRAVHELFASYSFKLTTRRFILDLFTIAACSRSQMANSSSGGQLAAAAGSTPISRSLSRSTSGNIGDYIPNVNASPA